MEEEGSYDIVITGTVRVKSLEEADRIFMEMYRKKHSFITTAKELTDPDGEGFRTFTVTAYYWTETTETRTKRWGIRIMRFMHDLGFQINKVTGF